MRDVGPDEYLDESQMIVYRSLVSLLIEADFPAWTVILLEDLFTPLIQELIRYIPQLFHLRSAPWYGGHRGTAKPLNITGHPPVEVDIVLRLQESFFTILGDLRPYDRPASISLDRKIQIRNLWVQNPIHPRSPIVGRPDLDIEFDLSIWERDITAFMNHCAQCTSS